MGDGLSYLERDTWSNLEMEDWELDALVNMLDQVVPQTPAELVISQRIIDAQCRRDQITKMKERDGQRPHPAG